MSTRWRNMKNNTKESRAFNKIRRHERRNKTLRRSVAADQLVKPISRKWTGEQLTISENLGPADEMSVSLDAKSENEERMDSLRPAGDGSRPGDPQWVRNVEEYLAKQGFRNSTQSLSIDSAGHIENFPPHSYRGSHRNRSHRWSRQFKLAVCDKCHKKIPIIGLICKQCKLRCHIKCEKTLSSACALFAKSGPTKSSMLGKNEKSRCVPTQSGQSFSSGYQRRSDSNFSQSVISKDEEPSITFQVSIDFDDEFSVHRHATLTSLIKEWEIVYESLVITEKIYTGLFTTLYRAHWYGEVALKLLSVDCDELELFNRLNKFKAEIAVMKKLRHENLVLFCGACINPPNVGYVTSWIRGQSVYNRIYVNGRPLSYTLAASIACQVVLAMSYLHSRRCLHKDLRTKNIFIEHDTKAIITDYGLSSFLTFSGNDKVIGMPRGRLCYLAPELLTSLRSGSLNLNYTKETDVYSFGTVYYEMHCSQMPMVGWDPYLIIWRVGQGVCPALPSMKMSKSTKETLRRCWFFCPNKRPSFTDLYAEMKRMNTVQRKPARSPSTPSRIENK